MDCTDWGSGRMGSLLLIQMPVKFLLSFLPLSYHFSLHFISSFLLNGASGGSEDH